VANANDESGRLSFFAVLIVEDFVVARADRFTAGAFLALLFVVFFFVAGTSPLLYADFSPIWHKVPLGGSVV
jgi:hypothetical protein